MGSTSIFISRRSSETPYESAQTTQLEPERRPALYYGLHLAGRLNYERLATLDHFVQKRYCWK
jgi:hypothetical protein